MESVYRIPDYQRGYSWKEEQLKDFWLDLEQLDGDRRHYTGVLTLEVVPSETWETWEDDRWIIKSRRYKPYYVVDGQQRLTTAIILMQCILECTGLQQLNYTPVEDIRRKYIFDSKPEELARSYLFGYEKDNPSYEFLKRRIFCETSDRHAPEEDTIYTKNLLSAKEFFTLSLASLNAAELQVLFTKLTQQLVFNVYEIASDIDVFVSFETMNNRGKPLSTLELLKNRLIFLSTRINGPEEADGDKLRRAINDSWKTTYHYLGKNDERPLHDDEFLRTHLSCYYPTHLCKIPARSEDNYENHLRLYQMRLEYFNRFLLNELFTPKRLSAKSATANDDLPSLTRQFIYEYSQNLKTSVEYAYHISTPDDSPFYGPEKVLLEQIGRLSGYTASPLLLSIFLKEKDGKKRATFLENLERWLFCQSLVSRTGYVNTRRINPAPNFHVEYVSGRTSMSDLSTQLDNIVVEMFRETPLSEMLNDWVKDGPSYYGWRSIKYFLFEYELDLQKASKSARQKIDWSTFGTENYKSDYETIEHIYPQRAKDKYWSDRFSHFTLPQKRLLRNSLGNLLALAKPRNSSLGNRSFPEKLGSDKTRTGYRYGSYSENEVALSSDWSAADIVTRGIRMLDFLERRWKVTIGDRQQKLKALGLEFIDNPVVRKRV